MKLRIAWIGKTKDPAIQGLTGEYLKRLSAYAHVDALALPSEAALLKQVDRMSSRSGLTVVLLDSQGEQLSSEELARFLEEQQNRNPNPLLFAVGPADGFSKPARKSASRLLALSRMTLPHELARVVLLEQLYRAFTIIKRHPYHLGH